MVTKQAAVANKTPVPAGMSENDGFKTGHLAASRIESSHYAVFGTYAIRFFVLPEFCSVWLP